MLTKLEKEKEYSQYDEINRKFLEKVLDDAQKNENSVIMAAWGGNQKDNKIAKKFFEGKDYKLYCFGMTSEKFPKHFSPLSYNNVNKFPHPIPYLKFNNWIKTQNSTDFDKEKINNTKLFIDWLNKAPNGEYGFVRYYKKLLDGLE